MIADNRYRLYAEKYRQLSCSNIDDATLDAINSGQDFYISGHVSVEFYFENYAPPDIEPDPSPWLFVRRAISNAHGGRYGLGTFLERKTRTPQPSVIPLARSREIWKPPKEILDEGRW